MGAHYPVSPGITVAMLCLVAHAAEGDDARADGEGFEAQTGTV
ncbi:MAG: hypothetical protein ACK57B_14655 [Betaproteobacteria bacterium]